jgi:hypothetical protein
LLRVLRQLSTKSLCPSFKIVILDDDARTVFGRFLHAGIASSVESATADEALTILGSVFLAQEILAQ